MLVKCLLNLWLNIFEILYNCIGCFLIVELFLRLCLFNKLLYLLKKIIFFLFLFVVIVKMFLMIVGLVLYC